MIYLFFVVIKDKYSKKDVSSTLEKCNSLGHAETDIYYNIQLFWELLRDNKTFKN